MGLLFPWEFCTRWRAWTMSSRRPESWWCCLIGLAKTESSFSPCFYQNISKSVIVVVVIWKCYLIKFLRNVISRILCISDPGILTLHIKKAEIAETLVKKFFACSDPGLWVYGKSQSLPCRASHRNWACWRVLRAWSQTGIWPVAS